MLHSQLWLPADPVYLSVALHPVVPTLVTLLAPSLFLISGGPLVVDITTYLVFRDY